jgi:HSP20 family protein
MDSKKFIPRGKEQETVAQEGVQVHPLIAMQREMNRVFEDFSRGFDAWPLSERFGTFNPSMNVAETDASVQVTIELPGLDEKDIEVSLTKDSLTIRGEKKEEKAENTKSYSHLERTYGSFSRTIPLPCEVNEDKVNASFKRGILTVTLPKSGQALQETKKIPVRPA